VFSRCIGGVLGFREMPVVVSWTCPRCQEFHVLHLLTRVQAEGNLRKPTSVDLKALNYFLPFWLFTMLMCSTLKVENTGTTKRMAASVMQHFANFVKGSVQVFLIVIATPVCPYWN
jgi:hypothetical protein